MFNGVAVLGLAAEGIDQVTIHGDVELHVQPLLPPRSVLVPLVSVSVSLSRCAFSSAIYYVQYLGYNRYSQLCSLDLTVIYSKD